MNVHWPGRFGMWMRRLVVGGLSVVAAEAVLAASLACRPQGGSGTQPSADVAPAATPAAAQPGDAAELVCEAYCSPDEPGVPVTEVRLVVSAPAPGSENLRKAAAAQNVEATVHEDGFDRGLFVRLPTIAPQARFAPAGPRADAKPLPGLDRLTVSAVTTSQDPAGALRLARPAESGRENVVLQVQGLQPGMNYYWRVQAPSARGPQVVMCRAPICPADRPRP